MRNKHILIVLSVIVAMAPLTVVVFAGNPDNPPWPPETTFSYTLEHIYDRLTTGAAGTKINSQNLRADLRRAQAIRWMRL